MRDIELAGLDAAPQSLDIDGRRVLIPAPGETLDYLSRHFQRHLFEASTSRPLPLKWVADILSLVERHAPDPGWADRLRGDRILMRRLEVFYGFTPVPKEMAGIIPVRPGAPPQASIAIRAAGPVRTATRFRMSDREVPAVFTGPAFLMVAAPSLWDRRAIMLVVRGGDPSPVCAAAGVAGIVTQNAAVEAAPALSHLGDAIQTEVAMSTSHCVILTTTGSRQEADRLAELLVSRKLAPACRSLRSPASMHGKGRSRTRPSTCC